MMKPAKMVCSESRSGVSGRGKRKKRAYSKTLSSVPSPSDRVGTSGRYTDTGDGRDDGVGGLWRQEGEHRGR
jgi:hypothetical protein